MDKSIWIEKYRPVNFNEIIGQDKNIKILEKMVSNGSLPHLLLHGKSGVGKTSTIISIANKLYGKNTTFMVMRLDASDDRGINTVREEIKGFADKLTPFNNSIKLIVLDEADSMTYDAQFALRRIIEKYSDNTRFCLICNYENKIIPPIKSRCLNIRFNPIDKDVIKSRLKYIAKCESVNYSEDSIDTIAMIANGDLRKAINMLQSLSMMKKKITSNMCYDSIGMPNPILIDEIFNKLIDKNVDYLTMFNYMKTNVLEKGILLCFILNQLTIKLSNYIINISDNITFINIMIDISKLECDIAISIFNDIYLAGLISLFKKHT
jgi:replication factor C subunit 3/5